MKVQESPRLPTALGPLVRQLETLLREHATQINMLSEGRLSAAYNAMPAVPTAGTYAAGDIVRNSNATVAGGGGSQYLIYGWFCTVGGEPGTWVELRCLTGT